MLIPDENDMCLVEFWDVTSNYYAFKLTEDVLNSMKYELNELDKGSDEWKAMKDSISFQEKYKNKRKYVHINEIENMFKVVSHTKKCTYQDINEYKAMYPFAFKDMTEPESEQYFEERIKGSVYTKHFTE